MALLGSRALSSEPWDRRGSKTPPLAGPPKLDWFGGETSPWRKGPGIVRSLLPKF